MTRAKEAVVKDEVDRVKKRAASSKPKTELRRKDWRDNHAKVLSTFIRLLKTFQRKPTLDELSAQTGLSVRVVSSHLKAGDFSETVEDLRILTSQVLMGIYSSAMEGKAQSQRLWLEVVENWRPQDAGLNLNVKFESVIVLPNNHREDPGLDVQGWTEADWDELEEDAKEDAKEDRRRLGG